MKFGSCQITPEQVRLLLFKECDWRGRKVLFDSSTVQKVVAGKNDKPTNRQADNLPCILEVSDGFTYVYKGPSADASLLGEMIFGAVAMNYKRVSFKIHIMDEPRRLMCTKVFCVPTSRRISRVERKTDTHAVIKNSSKPLNVPLLKEEGVSLSFSLDRGDSGYYGDQSPYSSVGSTYDYFSMFNIWDGNNAQQEDLSFNIPTGRKLSTSSNGSWQRRTFQNLATRFDLGCQSPNLLNVPTSASTGTSTDSQVYSNSSASCTTDSLVSGVSAAPHRKNKLGLALLITVADSAEMDVVRRCVEHSPQLQALVCRLRLATLEAGASDGFVSTLYRASTDAARWISDLMYGPRLQPVWLSLVTRNTRDANKTAETFISDLCNVLSIGDTKTTNFFTSTLLTHVLTYHLGWVTTVSPYDTVDVQKPPTTSASEAKKPYNALWAQLNDLCGSIGFPPRAAKTIICGSTNTQFMNRLLLVLTYFVRCGDVKKSDYDYQECVLKETKVVSVDKTEPVVQKSVSRVSNLGATNSNDSLRVPSNIQSSVSSSSTLAPSETSLKRSSTLATLNPKLSSGSDFAPEDSTSTADKPIVSQLRRNPTMLMSLKAPSDSSLNSSAEESEPEQKVVFVLGDNEKLVGLKNKSNDGKRVKKSSKVHNEPVPVEVPDKKETCTKDTCDQKRSTESPSKCCGQTLQHSKPIKHSGFKFEFDKYPQIVTNYMKSKNLEILDRHYIGKPGNLKLDNYQFDPTIVLPIQEERCETCYKCQLMESLLQTPTNASEMEYMNDMPRHSEPQYAKETIVEESKREMSPKTFVRTRKQNTLVVNVPDATEAKSKVSVEASEVDTRRSRREKLPDKKLEVKRIVEFPAPALTANSHSLQNSQRAHHSQLGPNSQSARSGFGATLLGGVTDHYVPDLILQGTIAKPKVWEMELRRDLNLTSYLNQSLETPIQAVAIVGDTNNWEVRVLGRECGGGCGGGGGGGGMSPLVGALLDALPAMWRANVPAQHCLSFLEGRLRELCVLSKTLADMLMSRDFCDIATLTKSLNIDVNDVPLLLAVATTHTPQVATRYGISYR